MSNSAFNRHASKVGRVPNALGHSIHVGPDVDKSVLKYGGSKLAHVNYEENWHPTEEEIFFGDALTKTAAPGMVPMRPVAASPGFGASLRTGLGLAAGGMLAAAIGTGVQHMIQRSEDRRNMFKYEESLRTAMQMSPTLQRHSFEELRGYLPMIAKASPTVAGEPRLLANYLETMIDAEGNLNLATFGEIASLEGSLLKNRDARNELSNAVILEGVKSFAKGTSEGMVGYMKTKSR